MNTDEQRDALRGIRPDKEWQDKVNSMTNAQVSAIYLRLKSQKKV